jgi:hypothetical protein
MSLFTDAVTDGLNSSIEDNTIKRIPARRQKRQVMLKWLASQFDKDN